MSLGKKVELARMYINLMHPLTSEKMALEIRGSPDRVEEKELYLDMIKLAKDYKLHTQMHHAQCSISVRFEPGEDELNGPHIILRIDSVDLQTYMRRLTIITGMIIVLLILLLR